MSLPSDKEDTGNDIPPQQQQQQQQQQQHTLTPEGRAAREVRLQAEHERYLHSIATVRSLPRLRSTIAGAGGKTNEMARLEVEREAQRLERMRAAAAAQTMKAERKGLHEAKVAKLEETQARKRSKKAAKKQKNKDKNNKKKTKGKKRRMEHHGGDGNGDGFESESEEASSSDSEEEQPSEMASDST